ncbi:hypothetical protein [Pediococcus damnosus]|nr:hypothetical protein [Pediococcus damnosus]
MHVIISTNDCINSIRINGMLVEHQYHDTEELALAAVMPTAHELVAFYIGWELKTAEMEKNSLRTGKRS